LQRTFRGQGGQQDTERVRLFIVPESAGPFSLAKLELEFRKDGIKTPTMPTSKGRVTVPLYFKRLKAVAIITYNGRGILRGRWRVNNQTLNFVTKQLYPGIRRVTIESPDIPGLPTSRTGLHTVTFEVLEPAAVFEEPKIFYYVTEGSPQARLGSLKLTHPLDKEKIPAGLEAGRPTFQWEAKEPGLLYLFALHQTYNASAPLISAKTAQNTYTLHRFDIPRLSPFKSYTWEVKAFKDGKLTAQSRPRVVSFSKKTAQEKTLVFSNLNIRESEPVLADLPKEMEKLVTIPTRTRNIQTVIQNQTDHTFQNVRVEFVVDGEIVDISFISMIAPGKALAIRGTYPVYEDKTQALKIIAAQGEGKNRSILASIEKNI
jgi:hypothetical protein